MLPLALAIVVTAYGGLLRLDAFVQAYGTLDRPAWARVLTHRVAPLARFVRPRPYRWDHVDQPYVGGDPINYLKYAREMRSFYQAHVREPMFLALTRTFLWTLSDQDAGVSVASITASTLAIFATYLLGAAVLSRSAGLIAALLIAVEYDLISWSIEGWRDDLFMAMVAFSAWAFVRCRREPSLRNGAVLGVLAAGACLTRITALSFIVPALGWLIVDAPGNTRRARTKAVGIAALALAIVAGPYFVSCAIATGDPFYAIDYHTGFYRYGEGQPWEKPMSAATYVTSKIVRRPIATLDTAITGLFVQPFTAKWIGFEGWVNGTGAVLSALAIAGLLIAPFFADGRVLLVVLLASVLPYAFTWNIRGGAEFRFTMHTYPLYVLASLAPLALAVHAARAIRADPGRIRTIRWKRVSLMGGTALAAIVAVCAIYIALPWFVAREQIASGDDASIETGARDRTFFRDGWSRPYRDSLTFRLSGERATIRIPLPVRRTYHIVLRLDPVAPEQQHRAVVLLNRQLFAVLHLMWDPNRVGAYPLQLPADKVRVGSNELTIVSDTTVPAESATIHLPPQSDRSPLGVRFWYLRVLGTGP
jgi:hypothetical protein